MHASNRTSQRTHNRIIREIETERERERERAKAREEFPCSPGKCSPPSQGPQQNQVVNCKQSQKPETTTKIKMHTIYRQTDTAFSHHQSDIAHTDYQISTDKDISSRVSIVLAEAPHILYTTFTLKLNRQTQNILY